MFIKKSAFTLAEILITLTIIGIIAVAVLPRTFGNMNAQAARNKFRTTYAQIQTAFKMANEVDGVSFLEKKLPNDVRAFFKTYLKAKEPTQSHILATGGITFQLPNGAQIILPKETIGPGKIIQKGNGCISTTTLSEKCVAYIDINGTKGPNSVLGTVVTSGTNDTPEDETDSCISGTYAINKKIAKYNCVLRKDVYYDIFPVVLEDNNIVPYSNAVKAALSQKISDAEEEKEDDNEPGMTTPEQ